MSRFLEPLEDSRTRKVSLTKTIGLISFLLVFSEGLTNLSQRKPINDIPTNWLGFILILLLGYKAIGEIGEAIAKMKGGIINASIPSPPAEVAVGQQKVSD